MTDKRIRVGTDDFSKLRRDNGYFVDKSSMIRDVIHGSDVILLPRPRRFGKTLNLSMLRYFFERTDHDDRRSLFDSLVIERDAEAMRHFGRYPVIFLSLKNVKGKSWDVVYEKLVTLISECYMRHAAIVPELSDVDQKIFVRLQKKEGSRADVDDSLRKLISCLYAVNNQPVIVLLDEYDSPAIEAFKQGYLSEMLEFLRAWLGGGLKHENGPALYRAVITGILRIAKESIFSDLNNLDVWSGLTMGPFEDKFGFTEPEVERLLADFDCQEEMPAIREWYNGYRFGNTVIYNPWSVLSYVNQRPTPIGPRWLNTGSDIMVHEELDKGGEVIRQDLEKLLAGEGLRYPIREDVIFDDVGREPANIWSFLFFAGYLRAEDPRPDILNSLIQTYALRVPNQEVVLAYQRFVARLFKHEAAWGDSEVRGFLFALIEGAVADFELRFQQLVLQLLSYHNVGRCPEAVYHAFVLGLLANLRTLYDIQSEPESGYGRADILMIPKTEKYPLGFVIEFKSLQPHIDIDSAVRAAFTQIQEKAYPSRLGDAGVSDSQIRRLVIVVQGKTVRVEARVGEGKGEEDEGG